MEVDEVNAATTEAASEGNARGRASGTRPPLPPGDRPRAQRRREPTGNRETRGRGYDNRNQGRGERRARAPTRPGWDPTGEVDDHGKPAHSGQCEGCRVSTVVNFRPVIGGNPPLCGVCLDSLKAATANADGEGTGAGGASRPRSGAASGGRGRGSSRFSPYGAVAGAQMIVMDPSMMGAYAGAGGMMMMMPPYGAPAPFAAAFGQPGGAGAGGRGKSRSWTRPGAEIDASGIDTSNVPCLFWQKGSCRAGDACKYSHAGAADDFVANTGPNADASMNIEM